MANAIPYIVVAVAAYLMSRQQKTNVEIGKQDDLAVTASTFGKSINLIYGPENRHDGNIIWSTGLLERKKKKKSGKGGGSTTTTYTYSTSLAIAMASGRRANGLVGIRRIYANNKLIYDASIATSSLPAVSPTSGQVVTKAYGTHTVMEEMHFFPGSTIQNPDTTIESIKGVGETSAYRGICYIVLKDLQLADFGNRVPNLEFEVEADASISVGQVLHDLCAKSGVLTPSAVGLTMPLRGMVVTNDSAENAIKNLAIAYNFDIAQQHGDVRFVKRGFAMKAAIPIGDLGARQADASHDNNPVWLESESLLGLPKEAVVTYKDPAFAYQKNSQRAFKDGGDPLNKYSVNLPIVLSADEARATADRALWDIWTSRRSGKIRYSDKWVRRDPGDIVGIPVAGNIVPYIISRVTRGNNGVLDVELQRNDPEIYTSEAAGIAGNLPSNTVRLPGETELVLIDSPIFRDLDDDTGFYWAVTAPEDGWRGAEIFRSSDGGATYSSLSSVAVRSTFGNVASALPTGPVDYWDRGNSITVVMDRDDDELESLTEFEILNGNNAFWLGPATGIGGEVIQFATATLTAPQTYVLTDLLRGRRGTESFAGTHGSNETFILLDPSVLGRSDLGPADWNASRLYKPVSILTSIDDTASQAFTNTGVGKMPFSPVHVLGVRDTSNNLTVEWVRRSRLQSSGLAGAVPLGEETEAYEADIYSGAAVVRTIAATAPTISYSAAEQSADGLVPGNPVVLRVYMLSAVRGRGFPAISTV